MFSALLVPSFILFVQKTSMYPPHQGKTLRAQTPGSSSGARATKVTPAGPPQVGETKQGTVRVKRDKEVALGDFRQQDAPVWCCQVETIQPQE